MMLIPKNFRLRTGAVKFESMAWQEIMNEGIISEIALIGAKS